MCLVIIIRSRAERIFTIIRLSFIDWTSCSWLCEGHSEDVSNRHDLKNASSSSQQNVFTAISSILVYLSVNRRPYPEVKSCYYWEFCILLTIQYAIKINLISLKRINNVIVDFIYLSQLFVLFHYRMGTYFSKLI